MNPGPQQPPPRRPAPRRDDLQRLRGGPPPGAEATQYTSSLSGSLPQPPPRRPMPPPRPRPVDPPTEVIPRIEDDYDDDYEDDDYYDDEEEAKPAPEIPPDGPLRKTVRGVGELLITMGLVVLLFVVYEVYVTDLLSAEKQEEATQALDSEWGANTVEAAPPDPQRQQKLNLIEGKAFAKMYIPVFGEDWGFSVVEGTSDKHLEVGPGHYVDTAQPGENGNFSVAGHRVGKGAPFNDLDLLGSCEAIVVETQTTWFVYRVLPLKNEIAGWAEGKAASQRCQGVAPPTTYGPEYGQTVGQEIVLPSQGEVISPVPHLKSEPPAIDKQAKLMTLTTCHPRFSDKQRLIVHAVMTQTYPKKDGFVPPEMKEQ